MRSKSFWTAMLGGVAASSAPALAHAAENVHHTDHPFWETDILPVVVVLLILITLYLIRNKYREASG